MFWPCQKLTSTTNVAGAAVGAEPRSMACRMQKNSAFIHSAIATRRHANGWRCRRTGTTWGRHLLMDSVRVDYFCCCTGVGQFVCLKCRGVRPKKLGSYTDNNKKLAHMAKATSTPEMSSPVTSGSIQVFVWHRAVPVHCKLSATDSFYLLNSAAHCYRMTRT